MPVDVQAHQLIRVVRDVLVVVGNTPKVWRVLDTKPGSVTGFQMEPIDGEYFEGGQRWPPELFTPKMLIYGTGLAIPGDALKPVDLLHVWCGASKFGTQCESYWLWQVAATKSMMGHMTLLDTREALRSSWLQSIRTQRKGGRGITLRE